MNKILTDIPSSKTITSSLINKKINMSNSSLLVSKREERERTREEKKRERKKEKKENKKNSRKEK